MSLAALNCAYQQQQEHFHHHRKTSAKSNTSQNMMTLPPDPPAHTATTYYASGSLPRITAQTRRPNSRNSMSLTRSSSVRNSWAATVNRLTQVPPPALVDNNKTSPQSSIAPTDSVSVNSRQLSVYNNGNPLMVDAATKNKYNTLTPAEARRFMCARPATRTASVLHKPRPPPLVVTNLDDLGPKPPYASQNGRAYCSNGSRSGSSCSNHSNYREHRNSINLGQHYSNRYAFSTQSNGGNNNHCNNNTAYNSNKQTTQASPNDSESNLSFRSSLDIVDSAYGSDRLQTMSVDLGQTTQQYLNCTGSVLPYNPTDTNGNQDATNKLSDESYTSAMSHQSDTSKLKSLSKISLSSSTSKAFHSHLYSLKRFFRHLPSRRSLISNSNNNGHERGDSNYSDKPSLAESVSQICLNRSQSPPVCPPPPGELKSMSYMESSNVAYSNYDDFTRARNQQTSSILAHNNARQQQPEHSTKGNHDDEMNLDSAEEVESWQLASLPVSYERNLATVFEEKQNSIDYSRNSQDKNHISINNNNNINENLIQPPANFDEKDYVNLVSQKQHSTASTSSSQSLTSITTTDSVLDFHRQTATSFRFSYAQPRSFDQHNVIQNNSGLPPRMPINGELKQGASSSSSSVNSLAQNGCDHQQGANTTTTRTNCGVMSAYNTTTTANHMGDNDGDTTIMSDTSTLNGDVNNLSYKCAELERTVYSLKNKIISKEKELTDLQLKQWSSDYLIDQLKSTIGRLEKENAQLKTSVFENTHHSTRRIN